MLAVRGDALDVEHDDAAVLSAPDEDRAGREGPKIDERRRRRVNEVRFPLVVGEVTEKPGVIELVRGLGCAGGAARNAAAYHLTSESPSNWRSQASGPRCRRGGAAMRLFDGLPCRVAPQGERHP